MEAGAAPVVRKRRVRRAVASGLHQLMQRIEGKTSLFRSIVLNVLAILAAALILPIVIAELTGDRVTITPVSVPETISATGLNGAVVANRLWDAWSQVTSEQNISKEIRDIQPSSQRIEFSIPESGLSFGSIIQHVRTFFGQSETNITGELVCIAEPCERKNAALRLRILDAGIHVVQMPPIGEMSEDAYFRRAISEVLLHVDPLYGILALRNGQDDRAISELRRLVRQGHPDSVWALVSIGNMLAAKKSYAGAIESFNQALALRPSLEDALISRANSQAESGALEAALESIRKAQMLNPKSARAAMQMGEIEARRGNREAAAKSFERASQLAPNAPQVSFSIGMMHLNGGESEKAKDAFRATLEIDPEFSGAREGLALIAMLAEDYAEVAHQYGEAVRQQPENAQAHAAFGLALANAKDFAGSARAYRRALEIIPENAEWHDALGQALERMGDLEKALEAFEKAASQNAKLGGLWFRIGSLRQQLGMHRPAHAAFETYINLEPDGLFAAAARNLLEKDAKQ